MFQIQENLLATSSTDTLSPKRKRELSDKVFPALLEQASELEGHAGSGKEKERALKAFLERTEFYPIGQLADTLSDMAGQHVFTGEVAEIYAMAGISYN